MPVPPKITGAPHSDIPNWSWNEKEKFSPDPTKKETNPFNKMKTKVGKPKEKYRDIPHGDPDKLALVLVKLVTTTNSIIDELALVPSQLEELKEEVATDIAALQTEVGSHEHAAPAGAPPPPPSDRRLKHYVNIIGTSPSGLNIYTFRFKDDKYGKGLYQGVMSDEVPSMVVIKDSDGYDRVDYSQIDVDFRRLYE
tara:strand:+ start:454 stop:1041 length:588 start_codon:yes stop_codon:yes gene_type:complete